MGLDSFRAGADRYQRPAGEGRGDRKFINFDEEFIVPIKEGNAVGDISTPIIINPHTYRDHFYPDVQAEYMRFGEHKYQTPKGLRSFICNNNQPLQPELGADKCIGCFDYVSFKEKDWAKAKLMTAFDITHLVWYHWRQKMDKKTHQPVHRRKGNEPLLIWAPCDDQTTQNPQQSRCWYCQNRYERVFGARLYMKLGSFHFDQLLDAQTDQLDKKCLRCGTAIQIHSYYCVHCRQYPGGEWDVASCGKDDKELKRWTKEPQQCPRCSQVGQPQPGLECGYLNVTGNQKWPDKGGSFCRDAQGNQVPETLNILDSVLYVYRLKGTLTTLEINPIPASAFRAEDGRMAKDVAAAFAKEPLPFSEWFAPESPDSIARRLEIRNPLQAAGRSSQPYGQQPQQPYPPPQGGYPQPGAVAPPPQQNFAQPQQPGGYPPPQQPAQGYPPQPGYPPAPQGNPGAPPPPPRPNYGR